MTSRDPAASYYDLTLPDGTRTEVWSVLRAVLTEEEALGYVKACILTRIMRDGKKLDVDRLREVEKVGVEAGMLREAMAAHLATPDPMVTALDAVDASAIFNAPAGMEDAPGNEVIEPITDDDAEDETRVTKKSVRQMIEETEAFLRNDAPMPVEDVTAGYRARVAELERERDEYQIEFEAARCLRSEAERERDEAREAMRKVVMELPSDVLQNDDRTPADRVRALRHSRDEAREDAMKVKRTYNELFDSAGKEITTLRQQLAALRNHYRPRRQSEEPAPRREAVLIWNASRETWYQIGGINLHGEETWTHQPPAPERKGE